MTELETTITIIGNAQPKQEPIEVIERDGVFHISLPRLEVEEKERKQKLLAWDAMMKRAYGI